MSNLNTIVFLIMNMKQEIKKNEYESSKLLWITVKTHLTDQNTFSNVAYSYFELK